MIPRSGSAILLAAITFFINLNTCSASTSTRWVTYTESDGTTVYLDDNRRPSLYTGNFGDCLGSSTVNVTRFDAAYYKDNMTVLFHLTGNTAVAHENLMSMLPQIYPLWRCSDESNLVYIGVYAYGESRFDLTFNPCNANIASLCPLNSSVPIEANGIIPVSESDVANIPSIALSIPDFEGEAILRIFANSTESEIGCYSAVITNGASFSQPKSVGTVLGVFALIALIASFATAIYGESIPVMRNHYAHSLSVMVVFAVYQHIFFTGALSMNWPSVLVAWWSNFAWAGGIIYSSSMQSSINHLIGNNVGNTSEVGAAGSGTAQEGLGGGFDLSLIYKRALSPLLRRDIAADIYQRDESSLFGSDVLARSVEQSIQKRTIANSSTGYKWYGKPVGDGLPLPGNYSGFAGTLAEEGIRVSNAFMTGFLWFLILLVLVVAAVIAFKGILETFVLVKLMRRDRLQFFRKHWMGYTALAALRTCLIAFFMIMLLTMFQFSYESSGGVKAIAAIVFVIFLIGIPGAALYACYYRVHNLNRTHKHEDPSVDTTARPNTLVTKLGLGGLSSKVQMPTWSRTKPQLREGADSIHDDEDYVKKFGWLSARLRRTKWWFFTAWIFYEFIRACFYGAASGHPMTQVFGLLVVEVLAFCGIIWMHPFEGRRLNIIVAYLLGFSKVATVALSAAFDVTFNLPRITTTIIGIAVIIIQAILTIITMIAVVVGAISTYMSLTRDRENFQPKRWAGMRDKYFRHLHKSATDMPSPPRSINIAEEPKGPYFNVASVRRMAKIEDEDPDFIAEMMLADQEPNKSYAALSQRLQSPILDARESFESHTPIGRSRAASRSSRHSVSYTNLPFGARLHRPSWSSRDFSEWDLQLADTPSIQNNHLSSEDPSNFTPTRASTSTPPRTRMGRPTSIGRAPTRSFTTPESMLRPVASVESLRIGGGASTPEVIGNVPSPIVRPRSGTFGSRSGNGGRSNTPTFLNRNVMSNSTLDIPPVPNRPLTPANEVDELYRTRTKELDRTSKRVRDV